MAAPVLQFKRGLIANLPALKAGEPGFTTDNYDFYIGLDSNSANNKFFGSHRYWTKETSSEGSGINLVEGTSNGADYVTLAAPSSVGAAVTFIFPGVQGFVNSVLTNDGNGNLTWASGSANPTFSGIATFTDTTDNTLGDPDTGAVQIDGGLGVNKNVTIGQELYVTDGATFNNVITPSTGDNSSSGIQWVSDPGGGSGDTAYIRYYVESGENTRLAISNQNDANDDIYLYTPEVNVSDKLNVGAAASITGNLYVGGQSEFIGIVTFRGGTINLGDSGTDDIVVSGEFASDLVPTTDNLYSLGSLSKQWKDLYVNGTADIDALAVSGISTFDSFVVFGNGVNIAGFSTIYNAHVINNFAVGGSFEVDTQFSAHGNADFAGIVSFTNGTNSTSYDNGAIVIDGGVGIQQDVHIGGTLDVTGNVTIGGTFVSLKGQDVFIENKDFILGYTTSITPNDDTANHAGVAIASTEGSPLVSFIASGINTLPDTYKQLMWFKNGTLGFSTDAFAFNYALAVGTDTMADGVRLAVGSGVTVSDTAVSASTFYGTLIGNVSGNVTSADQVKTESAADNAADYHLTFVDSNNGSATNEIVYTDGGLTYNPSTNNLKIVGLATASSFISTSNVLQAPTAGSYGGERIRLWDFKDGSKTNYAIGAEGSNIWFGVDDNIDGVGFKWYGNTTQVMRLGGTGNLTLAGDLTVGGNDIKASDGTTALTLSATTGNVKTGGDLITGSGYLSSPNGTRGLYIYDTSGNVSFQGKAVVNEIRSSSNANTLITLTDLDATFARNLTVSGIATVSGNFITGGDITVGGNDIKASDGTTAITLSNSTGDVALANDVTINGSLFVKGTTTEVNTETLKVEDSLIEIGLINSGGSLVAPTSDLNIDVGVIFHYYTSTAKKAGVYWDDSVSRVVVSSDLSESSSVITSSAYAALEVGSLWVNDCAGTSQVISCTGSERFLENITVDGGVF